MGQIEVPPRWGETRSPHRTGEAPVPTVRTTFQPDVDLEVGVAEAESLSRQGLLVPPVDPKAKAATPKVGDLK